jgi:enoyl-CoA hydratase
MSASSAELEIRRRHSGEAVAVLTASNPSRLNALDRRLMAELSTCIAEVGTSSDVRVMVLQGAGERSFIGGADINELAELDETSARSFIAGVHEICAGLRDLPIPVIARINGYCLGAGLEIAAACDLRVATEDSQFGMPEVQLGVPSVVEAALLPQLIGWGRTRELVFGGRSFTASEVESWGLVERVVARRDLDNSVDEWVESIVRAGPLAIRLQKELIRSWERLSLDGAIEAGIEVFARAYQSDEPKQRMARFLRRRRGRKKPR